MESRASARNLPGSAQKARLVIDMIRGKNVNKALGILRFAGKRAAGHIEKCLRSAVANANETAMKANIAIDVDELWVKGAFVNQGPSKNRRRVRPAPQGRAYRERRHFCHVTVVLSSDEPAAGRDGMSATKAAAPGVSRKRKTGGAVAAPRALRRAGLSEETEREVEAAADKESPGKEAKAETAPKRRNRRTVSAPSGEQLDSGATKAEKSEGSSNEGLAPGLTKGAPEKKADQPSGKGSKSRGNEPSETEDQDSGKKK
jgi:large subunit ribosomal protein L22